MAENLSFTDLKKGVLYDCTRKVVVELKSARYDAGWFRLAMKIKPHGIVRLDGNANNPGRDGVVSTMPERLQ
jgi:hypothetical protein